MSRSFDSVAASGLIAEDGFQHSVAEPLVALDRDWRYAWVNAAAERMKGQPAADILGRSIWDVYPGAVGTEYHAAHVRAMELGREELLEEYYAPLDVWYEVALYPCELGLWVWFRDVTARKRAEEQLRLQEERYRTLVERIPTALYRTSASGEMLYVNDALVRLLGYSDRDSFMRVNAHDVYVHAHDRHAWQLQLETEDEVSFEMQDRRADGSIIWVRDTARAVRNLDGSIQCYEGMLEDITAQHDAELQLQESEERFRLLADASDDVIWDWDAATGEVRWNAALRTVFGYPPDAVSRTITRAREWWSAHIHPDDRAAATAGFDAALANGTAAWSGEYRFRRLDGQYVHVLDRVYIGRDEVGGPTRIIGAMLDTARHRSAHVPHADTAARAQPLPPVSDLMLVDWLSRGDHDALDQLYRRHATMLFARARALTSSQEEAEEVVADVFVTAWSEAARYNSQRGTVAAWLLTICRSRALERVRKRNRRSRIVDDAARQDDAAPADFANTDRMSVESSLAQLSAPQRQVIELAYFNGLSHAQIAAELNQPLGTVKTRIRDGIARMRRLLAD